MPVRNTGYHCVTELQKRCLTSTEADKTKNEIKTMSGGVKCKVEQCM